MCLENTLQAEPILLTLDFIRSYIHVYNTPNAIALVNTIDQAKESRDLLKAIVIIAYSLLLIPETNITIPPLLRHFYSEASINTCGIMIRGKGRKRSEVVIPALHPLEYISTFLMRIT